MYINKLCKMFLVVIGFPDLASLHFGVLLPKCRDLGSKCGDPGSECGDRRRGGMQGCGDRRRVYGLGFSVRARSGVFKSLKARSGVFKS